MSNEKITEDITTTPPAKDAPALVKKIDRTTYIIRVHFSKTSKETMSDKIKHMSKNKMWRVQKNDSIKKPGFRKVLAPGL